jgi:hypothetical protein
MERSVSSINSQLGIKEAEISRLMAVTLELNDRYIYIHMYVYIYMYVYIS